MPRDVSGLGPGWQPGSFARSGGNLGFTLIELLVVITVLGALASFAVVRTQYTVDQAKIARAIGDIRALAIDAQGYQASSINNSPPPSLAAIDRAGLLDPWGRPYVYVPLTTGGTPRTDVFGVELNTIYDIYSMGKDGATATSITSGPGLDDVVLGNDGGFIGRASRY